MCDVIICGPVSHARPLVESSTVSSSNDVFRVNGRFRAAAVFRRLRHACLLVAVSPYCGIFVYVARVCVLIYTLSCSPMS